MSAADLAARRFLIDDEHGRPLRTVITWAELAEVNEEETMEEIALLAVGEVTVLGMCDWMARLPDAPSDIVEIPAGDRATADNGFLRNLAHAAEGYADRRFDCAGVFTFFGVTLATMYGVTPAKHDIVLDDAEDIGALIALAVGESRTTRLGCCVTRTA